MASPPLPRRLAPFPALLLLCFLHLPAVLALPDAPPADSFSVLPLNPPDPYAPDAWLPSLLRDDLTDLADPAMLAPRSDRQRRSDIVLPVGPAILTHSSSSTPLSPSPPPPPRILVALDDAEDADATFSFTFVPAPHLNVSDYHLTLSCTDPTVLTPADVAIAPPVLLAAGRAANYTATALFSRLVGVARLTVSFRPRAHAQDPRRREQQQQNSGGAAPPDSVAVSCDFVVAGISFAYLGRGDNAAPRPLPPSPRPRLHLARPPDHPLAFALHIQYPDGSSTDLAAQPPLADLSVRPSGADLLAAPFAPACLHSGALAPACPLTITPPAPRRGGPPTPPVLRVRLRPDAAGALVLHFVWPSLLAAQHAGLPHETSLTIEVAAPAAPAVAAVAPPGPFRRAGGEVLVCTVVGAAARPRLQYALSLGARTVAPFASRLSDERVAVGKSNVTTSGSGPLRLAFHTPPGSGKNVPWELRFREPPEAAWHPCPWRAPGSRFVFNYRAHDVALTVLNPDIVPASGGAVTCVGNFVGFNAAPGRDAVVLAGARLPSSAIQSANSTHILFTAPPRSKLGDAPSVSCAVTVAGLLSNELALRYSALKGVNVQVAGATRSEDGTFTLPICTAMRAANESVLLVAQVAGPVPTASLRFKWLVRERASRRQVFTASGDVTLQATSLRPGLVRVGVRYDVVVVVRDESGHSVSATVSMLLAVKRALGVALLFRSSRTIASPPVDARFTATVWRAPECRPASERLAYAWTYGGKTIVRSSETTPPDLKLAGPRRHGREFVIPRNLLRYGTHKVNLRVYYVDHPEVVGSTSSNLVIAPSALIAVIGAGESYVRSSCLEDVTLSAEQSYDPDIFTAERHSGLTYEWGCQVSIQGGAQFERQAQCPDFVFPGGAKRANKFTLRASHLTGLQSNQSVIFVRYSVIVRKKHKGSIGTRTSAKAVAIYELLVRETSLQNPAGVAVTGPDGMEVDRLNLPYYDRLIISPTAEELTTWNFRLKAPGAQVLTLLSNKINVLLHTGYYDPSDPSSARGPLGLQAYALTPGTTYIFTIEYTSLRFNTSTSVDLTLRTMDRPSVRFLSMAPSTGSQDTIFSAVASATGDDTPFKFYFYIRLPDGLEVCVDGCSGESSAWFRLLKPGTYEVYVKIVDARGQLVLGSAEAPNRITVLSNDKPPSETKHWVAQLQVAQRLGDHAAQALATASLATAVQLSSSPSATEKGALLAAATGLANLSMASGASAETARDYLSLSHQLSKPLPSHGKIIEDLCLVVQHSVHDAPSLERLSGLTSKLNMTLTSLTHTARTLFAHKQGLSSETGLNETKVNEALLVVADLSVAAWAEATRRTLPCGARQVDYNVGGLANVVAATLCPATGSHTRGTGGVVEVSGSRSTLAQCNPTKDGVGILGQRGFGAVGEFDHDFITESLGLTARPATPPVAIVLSEAKCASLHLTLPPTTSLIGGLPGDWVCEGAEGVYYDPRKKSREQMPKSPYQAHPLPPAHGAQTLGNAIETAKATIVESGLQRLKDTSALTAARWRNCRAVEVIVIGRAAPWWVVLLFVALPLLTITGIVWCGVLAATGKPLAVPDSWKENAYIDRDLYGRNPQAAERFIIPDDHGDDADEPQEADGTGHDGSPVDRIAEGLREFRDEVDPDVASDGGGGGGGGGGGSGGINTPLGARLSHGAMARGRPSPLARFREISGMDGDDEEVVFESPRMQGNNLRRASNGWDGAGS